MGSRDGISKSDFALSFAKKARVINYNYKFIKVNELLKVKRSNNMFMNINKFEKKFKIRLPLIKNEINNEVKKYF